MDTRRWSRKGGGGRSSRAMDGKWTPKKNGGEMWTRKKGGGSGKKVIVRQGC